MNMDEYGNLCLTRRTGQTLIVGDIAISVVEQKSGNVRLVIKAPRGVQIFREEVLPDDHPMQAVIRRVS